MRGEPCTPMHFGPLIRHPRRIANCESRIAKLTMTSTQKRNSKTEHDLNTESAAAAAAASASSTAAPAGSAASRGGRGSSGAAGSDREVVDVRAVRPDIAFVVVVEAHEDEIERLPGRGGEVHL